MITGKCKLTSNNHCLSSLSYTLHAHINVVGIIFSNFVLLLLFTTNHSLLAVFSRHKCANDTKYRTDNRWYCLMMCYSFFFFIIINYSHHQTDVAMFVSVTHQSREDPQVLLAMSAGCG
jgi:hypothetical protein